jgi:restriction endonuclease S subunit
MVRLGEVCEILDNLRKPVEKSERKKGPFPYYGATGIIDYIHEYIFDEKLVLVGEDGAKWGTNEKTAFIAEGKYWVNNHAHVLRPNREKILDEVLVYFLNYMDLSQYITGLTVPKLNQEKLRSIQIPLPLLEVQQEIVAEIECYQKIIDGCKQVIDAWKPDVETYLDEELKTYLATDQNNLVYDKLKEALEKFRMQDFYLIETDSNERAITAKIVCYLQEQFQSWNVDHEFNRNQEDIKRDNQGNRIIPDIIIHKRGTNDNLVMIEVKKHIFSNEYKERLRNNAKDLGYKYAFAITIDKNKPVEKWIEPLIEEKAKKDLLTSWPMVKLREVCEIIGGGTPSREKSEYWNGTIPWISSKHFNEDNRIVSNEYITESGLNNSSSKIAPKGSTILITRVSVGKYAIADKDYAINQDLTAIKPIIKNLDESFLFLTSSKLANEIKSNAVGLGVKGVTRDFVSNLQIPLPPLEVQIHIVDKIESERKIIDSLREMVKTYEEKIKRVIDSVWGE